MSNLKGIHSKVIRIFKKESPREVMLWQGVKKFEFLRKFGAAEKNKETVEANCTGF